MNMIKSSKALYWAYALRMIDADYVMKWSDSLIEKDIINDEILNLSTCKNSDPNIIMSLIKNLDICNELWQNDLLEMLIVYYNNCNETECENTKLLFDYTMIDDFDIQCKSKIVWLEDELCLMREGIFPKKENIKNYIIDELTKMKSAQQVVAPEPVMHQ